MSFPTDIPNKYSSNSNIINDNDVFALSFANQPMELIDNPPELLSSHNSINENSNDFAMTCDITPKFNFISGELQNDESNFDYQLQDSNTSFHSSPSCEKIIDSYANVAQQNYRLWLSSF